MSGFLSALTRALRREAAPEEPEDSIGAEFGKLSDEQRVDFIFAVATLEDPAMIALLERALDDPSDAVALAAARALSNAGCAPQLERFFAAARDERRTRLAQALDLFA